LPKYDYTAPGAYFVTICANQRECLFGEIVEGRMVLNEIGKIIIEEWKKTAFIRPYVVLDEFVVMTNHFHGIVWILDHRIGSARRAHETFGRGTARRAHETFGRGTARRAPTERCVPVGRYVPNVHRTLTIERFGKPVMGSVPTIVRAFKSAATKRVNEINPFFGSVWQRNYYERVIRSEGELNAVRHYIRDNPGRWEEDPERK
jgi:REP element-mobilizing transposase RayT